MKNQLQMASDSDITSRTMDKDMPLYTSEDTFTILVT